MSLLTGHSAGGIRKAQTSVFHDPTRAAQCVFNSSSTLLEASAIAEKPEACARKVTVDAL